MAGLSQYFADGNCCLITSSICAEFSSSFTAQCIVNQPYANRQLFLILIQPDIEHIFNFSVFILDDGKG